MTTKKTGYDLYLDTHTAGSDPEIGVVYDAPQIVAFEDIKAGRRARSREDFGAELAAFTSFAPGAVQPETTNAVLAPGAANAAVANALHSDEEDV